MHFKCMVAIDKDNSRQFLKVTAGAPGSITLLPGWPDGTTPANAPSVFPIGSTLASIAAANGVSFGAGVRLLTATLSTDVTNIFE
jgi:hypothetical protein